MKNPLLEGLDELDKPDPVADKTYINDSDRFILQNIFDVGGLKDRREAYLKKLGMESNPKDENMIRPIGSEYVYKPIDPGMGFYKTSFSKGLYKEIASEMLKDTTDLTGAVIENIGAAIARVGGGVIGAVSGMGVGSIATGTAGVMLGGALSEAGSQALKEKISEALVDPEIPVDRSQQLLETMMVGTFSGAIAKGAASIPDIKKNFKVSSLKRGLNSIRKLGKEAGVLDADIASKIMANPEKFTEEAVSGSLKKFSNEYKQFFGMSPEDFDLNRGTIKNASKNANSYVGKVLAPLNAAKEAEIDRLAKNPLADVKIFTNDPANPGVLDYYSRGISNIIEEAKMNVSDGQVEALAYMKKNIGDIVQTMKDSGIKVTEEEASDLGKLLPKLQEADAKVNFKMMRDHLSKIQSDIFESGKLSDGAQKVLRKTFGGSSDVFEEGARAGLDRVAAKAGSKLPDINAQIHKTIVTYQDAAANMNKENVLKAFLGKDNVSKIDIRKGLDGVESVVNEGKALINGLDPELKSLAKIGDQTLEKAGQLAGDFDARAAQTSLESMFNDAATYGSANVKSTAFGAGLKKATQYAGVTFPVGVAIEASGVPGATKAVSTGAALYGMQKGVREGLAVGTPKIAVDNIAKAANKLKQLSPEALEYAAKNPEVAGLMSYLKELGGGVVEGVASSGAPSVAQGMAGTAAAQAMEQAVEKQATPEAENLKRIQSSNPLLEGIDLSQ